MHPSLISLLSPLILIFALILSTNAIYAHQAGVIDWHKQYLGVPLTHTQQVAPRFHKIGGAGGKGQAVWLAATERNILGAVNPSEGNIVWRRPFEPNDPIQAFKPHSDGLVSLSGVGGSAVRLFEVLNGNLIWETHLFDPATNFPPSPELAGPSSTGTAIEFDRFDIFILSSSHQVRRLNGAAGTVLWGWSHPSPDSVFLTGLLRTQDGLYAVGLEKGIKDLSVHVISLDPETGEIKAQVTVPSSISKPEDIVVLKSGYIPNSPLASIGALAFLDNGSVKQVLLTPSLEKKYLSKPLANKYGPFSRILDLGVSERGYLTTILEDKKRLQGEGAAHVYRLEREGLGLEKAGELGASGPDTPWTVYSAGLDRAHAVYIAKLSHSSTLRSASYELFVPSAAQGRGMTTGFTFPYDSHLHGGLMGGSIDVVNTSEYVYASRIVITTSSGGVLQYQQEKNYWGREEGLSEAEAIVAVELPERSNDLEHMYHIEQEGWVERLQRQLVSLKDLPSFLLRFSRRFLLGTYPSPPSTSSTSGANEMGLYRDTYGFKKILVVATKRGKIYGIETAKGGIVWSARLEAGADPRVKVKPIKLVTLKTVSEGLNPELGLVVEVQQPDPSTGEQMTTTGLVKIDPLSGVAESILLFHGPSKDVLELDLPGGAGKVVGVVDSEGSVHIYPHDAKTVETFNNATESIGFSLLLGSPTSRYLQGYSLAPLSSPPSILSTDREGASSSPEASMPVFEPYGTWRSAFPPGENIVRVTKREKGAVAGIGRVLGDRRTLYKYLNPHIVAVVTESRVREGTDHQQQTYAAGATKTEGRAVAKCSIYLLDESKGTVLYSSSFPANVHSNSDMGSSDGGCDVKVELVENWLMWHYYDNEGGKGDKGWKMVSVEFYEGTEDEKTKSVELSKEDPHRAVVVPVEQSFIFPGSVNAMRTTRTKYGISSKDLVVINAKGQVQTFSRRFLDPRRPKTKPSQADAELGLIQYDVLIPDDPRRILSHGNYVLASSLLTLPTQLESTSLVFAYGVDMFLSRTSPSGTFDLLGEGFNKIQLVCTVVGLAVAIAITKPLVRQKGLKAKWYP